MRKNLLLTLTVLLVLLTTQLAFATTIPLLAVSENGQGQGATAELLTKEGTGKIYFETNILSETDTQLSARMAKEVICADHIECAKKDFFYTITTNSPTIKGPSGGAGLALITFAHLNNKKIPQDISISGTINPGGYIGMVGGLKEKIATAKVHRLTTLFIPYGAQDFEIQNKSVDTNTSQIQNQTNNTISQSLVTFGEEKGIRVIEVGTIDEVLEHLYDIKQPEINLTTPEFYTETMNNISNSICNRAKELNENSINLTQEQVATISGNESNATVVTFTNSTNYRTSAQNLLNNATEATARGDYYASASYCFGATLQLRHVDFLFKNLSKVVFETKEAIEQAKNVQKHYFENLNEIQIHSVVAERLQDADKNLKEAEDFILENKTLQARDRFAYAYERAKTAEAWATFFDNSGNSVEINNDLTSACDFAITSAETRIQYVQFYTNLPLIAQDSIAKAREQRKSLEHPLCIFNALKAKAQADVLTSVFGINQEELPTILLIKKNISERIISKQITKDNFPILGYSYIEYGQALFEQDPYAALQYFQLAQEFSNLDIFVETDFREQEETFEVELIPQTWFLLGIAAGLLFAASITKLILVRDENRKKKKAKKTKK